MSNFYLDVIKDRGLFRENAQGQIENIYLLTIADVDARGAHLHAQGAIDAITQAQGARITAFLAWPRGFAATRVVRHGQGVLVEHHALEALEPEQTGPAHAQAQPVAGQVLGLPSS